MHAAHTVSKYIYYQCPYALCPLTEQRNLLCTVLADTNYQTNHIFYFLIIQFQLPRHSMESQDYKLYIEELLKVAIKLLSTENNDLSCNWCFDFDLFWSTVKCPTWGIYYWSVCVWKLAGQEICHRYDAELSSENLSLLGLHCRTSQATETQVNTTNYNTGHVTHQW